MKKFSSSIKKNSLLTVALLVSIHSVQAQSQENTTIRSKAELVRIWQKYFRSLRTLQFEYKSVTERHPLKEQENTAENYKYTIDGNRFRVETQFPQTQNAVTSKVHAYDGKIYQELQINRTGLTSLRVSRRPLDSQIYGDTPPILVMFYFAFRQTDPVSIAFLQTVEPWQRVEQNIQKMEIAQNHGVKGWSVTIKGQKSHQDFKVFVDGGTGFPLSIAQTQILNIKGKAVSQVGYSDAVKTQLWQGPTAQGPTSRLTFPLKIESRLMRDKALFASGYLETTSPVQINLPIKSKGIFTLPRSQASEVYDQDKNNK